MRVILNARVSTRHLQSDGFSVETQLEKMRDIAREHNWIMVGEYTEYESAFEEGLSRTELNKVLDAVRRNAADALLFFSSDRFTRDVADGVILRRELYKMGVKLYFCYPALAEVRSENELVNILTDWQSQQYVEKLRESSMRGYRAKVESGAYGQGTPPYGYRIEGERREAKLVIVKEQATVISWIFEWFVFDNLTSTKIARKLNEMGVLTPGEVLGRRKVRQVRIWQQTTVCKILRDETYAGTWYGRRLQKVGKKRLVERPRSEWIPVPVEPIIPRQLWEAAQQQLNARLHPRNVHHEYLMGRRLRCRCGYAIHSTIKRVGTPRECKYYVCCGYTRVKGKCGLPGFRQDLVEPAVWRWIRTLMDNPEALLEGYRATQAEQEKQYAHRRQQLATLDEQISDYEAKLTRLLDLYLDGGFPRDALDARKAEYNEVLERMRAHRSALAEQIEQATITDEDIISITTFVRTVKEQLADIGDADFATKRQLVEVLNLTGTLSVEEGIKILYLHWCLQDFRLLLTPDSAGAGADSGSISSTAEIR